MTTERAYWLAWAQIPGFGPVLLKRIYEHFGSLDVAWSSSDQGLIEVNGIGQVLLDAFFEVRNRLDPDKFLLEHLAKNPNFLTPSDPEYPRLLLEIADSPSVLYYEGQLCSEENKGDLPCITIVGTRAPTPHGRRWGKKISQALAQSGFSIVSSMSAGLDGEMQQNVLDIDGRTIGILATGLDVVLPHSVNQLYQNVRKKGLLLSEYPRGSNVHKGNFVARNRLLAALSRAVIVIEAGQVSGCLTIARYANEFGRDVYVVPNSPEVEEALGCLKLLRDGAEIILSIDELLNSLGAMPAIVPTLEVAPELPENLKIIWQAFSGGILTFDQLVNSSQMPASQLSGALLELELLGLVQQLPGMRYQRL
jgi:DNA processing protein